MSYKVNNNYTNANLAVDTDTLQKYANSGGNEKTQELCLLAYSIADRALRDKDISPQLTTLQELNNQISKMTIPNGLPLKAVIQYLIGRIGRVQQAQIGEQFPLGQLALELLPLIFSVLSAKELGRLNRVSKAIQEVANKEEIWEKLSKKQEPELSQTKHPAQLWKDFYELAPYEKNAHIAGYIKMCVKGKPSSIPLIINIKNLKTTILHAKRIIHKQFPELPIADMMLIIWGKVPKDDSLLADHKLENLECIHLVMKSKLK